MDVAEAQHEVQSIYIGGFVGQLVSGAVWLASVASTTWISPRAGILVLVFGGMFIFPITQLGLRIAGRPTSLSAGNPLRELAIELAFLVPLLFPLVGAATIHRAAWFYPSMMIIVGAHYLPFAFLYGMRQFIALSAILLSAGLLIGLYAPDIAVGGAWLTSAVLVVFAFTGRAVAQRSRIHRTSEASTT
jgi:uncharacterized protein DUF7010